MTKKTDAKSTDTPAKHAGGRPTLYDPAFCQQVIDLGKQGASKAEMALALDCARPTMDAWIAAHSEFAYAVKLAIDLAQGWWEAEGRKATFGAKPGFNATSYIFNMKNRFSADWKDKTEHDVTLAPHEDWLASLK